jgi:hypothetical protein
MKLNSRSAIHLHERSLEGSRLSRLHPQPYSCSGGWSVTHHFSLFLSISNRVFTPGDRRHSPGQNRVAPLRAHLLTHREPETWSTANHCPRVLRPPPPLP